MGREIMEKTAPPADRVTHYGPAPEQFAEIRAPRAHGPHSVAILIHGGFWRPHRDLHHMSHIAALLADDGVASFNIEYRRTGQPGGGWPGTCEDIRIAASHLSTLEGLDLTRVVVAGFSAGGHLALWLAAERLLPMRVLPLRGVITLGGALDLRRCHELNLGAGAVAEFLGGSPEQFPDRYRASNPADRVPLGVPQRLLHGVADEIVPIEISRRYFEAARSAGDDVRLVEIPGADHHDMIDPESVAWPVVRETFLELLR